MARFALIGGANKCGSTSLFRYLAAHPSVSLSSTKELRYFYEHASVDLAEYEHCFVAKPDSSLLLEASPQYLHGGAQVALHIFESLPECKLIFILRDPVDRMASYYRADFGQQHLPSFELSFADVVNLDLSESDAYNDHEEQLADSFRHEILRGFYAEHLQQYLSIFPSERIKIVFFDELIRCTAETVKDVCTYLELSPSFFDDFVFAIENRTRGHRWMGIRKFAYRTSNLIEPLLIRYPAFKRSLRSAYNVINETTGHGAIIDAETMTSLRKAYEPHNRRLAELLGSTYGQKVPTAWLGRPAKGTTA